MAPLKSMAFYGAAAKDIASSGDTKRYPDAAAHLVRIQRLTETTQEEAVRQAG